MLLPVRNADEPFCVDSPDVTGMKPSLTVDHFCRRLRVVPVSSHDIRTPGKYLPVGCDPDLHPPDRVTDGPEPVIVQTVDGNDRRTFRQAVSLDDAETDRFEKLPELLPQSRTPGTEEPHPSTGSTLYLCEHQPIRKCMPDLQIERGFPFPGSGGIFPANPHRPVEQPLTKRGTCVDLLDDPALDPLEKAGNGGHNRRSDLQHVLTHRFDAFRKGECGAACQTGVVTRHPLK